jgi:leucyl-tRNA synthetase
MDPKNDNEFVAKEKVDYWKNVDLYIGGAEHATGHLLYSRFWTKFLYDLGYIPFDEPFQKMINQGMIQGNSALAYRVDFVLKTNEEFNLSVSTIDNTEVDEEEYESAMVEVLSDIFHYTMEETPSIFVSVSQFRFFKLGEKSQNDFYNEIINKYPIFKKTFSKYQTEIEIDSIKLTPIHVDINFLDGDKLDTEKLKNWREEYKDAEFITEENGDFIVGREVDKMSKSKYNVQTPDDLVDKYGADTLRCYEMFLGPLEQAKPWDTQGITGVNGFLKKLWRLFHTGENESFYVDTTPPSGEKEGAELKSLHKTIKKVKEDIERFSFNTPVSTFMICVNELTALKCNKKAILQDLLIILSPYAPHIAEELWAKLGNAESITYAVYPKHNEEYLVESNHKYPVSFNGKMRFMLELPANMSKDDVEAAVMANTQTAKYLDGKTPKKVIVVPNKIVNFVV